MTQTPSLAYEDLKPGAAIVEIKIPRKIDWSTRGENYAASLDAIEQWIAHNEPGLDIQGVSVVNDPYGAEMSHLGRNQMEVLKPDVSWLDKRYGSYKVRDVLKAMGLEGKIKMRIIEKK